MKLYIFWVCAYLFVCMCAFVCACEFCVLVCSVVMYAFVCTYVCGLCMRVVCVWIVHTTRVQVCRIVFASVC